MESLGFNFSLAVCAQLIDVACTADNIEMADKWVTRVKNKHPHEMLDLQKVTKYAGLLITKNRFDGKFIFII